MAAYAQECVLDFGHTIEETKTELPLVLQTSTTDFNCIAGFDGGRDGGGSSREALSR